MLRGAEIFGVDNMMVSRHESDLGTWTHTNWTPPPGSRLAGAVERIWHFDGTLKCARERVFPDGTLEVIVQLDTPHRPGIDGPTDRFPPLCVGGIRTTAEVVEAPPDRCRVLGLTLTPTGAFALLANALRDFTALTVDLREVIGRSADELGTRVHDAGDGTQAVSATALWACERIVRGPEPDSAIERAFTMIRSDGGTQSIEALDAWHGRSRARFTAAFRDRVGVSPKRFARIVRFDRALRLMCEGRMALGEIALAAGYYDQAHFSNEFFEHAGMTPRAYVRALRYPSGTSLADAEPEQNFQDSAAAVG